MTFVICPTPEKNEQQVAQELVQKVKIIVQEIEAKEKSL